MRSDQLDLLRSVSIPSVHPSGEWAVVSLSRPDFDVDSYVGQLWRVPLQGDPRRITRGQGDSSPEFSPNGELIGFLRPIDGKPQLALVRADGGEPMIITDAKLGVSQFCFSPDGSQIAFTSRVPEDGRYGSNPDISAGQEDPRYFTSNKLQMNGMGWVNGRPSQVFVIDTPDIDAEPKLPPKGRAAKKNDAADAKGKKNKDAANPLVPKPKQVTTGKHSWADITFTPDGSAVVARDLAHENEKDHLANDLYRIKLKSGKAKKLNSGKTKMSMDDPTFSNDGKHLYFSGNELGEDGLDFVGNHSQIWVMPAEGGEPTCLTDPSITAYSHLRPTGRNGLLFTDDVRGSSRLLKVTPSGTLTVIYDSDLTVTAAAEAGGTIFASVASATAPAEIAVIEDEKTARVLTDFCHDLGKKTTIIEPVEFTATAADGYAVHGWILKPKGKGPHPVLLNIHGGPYAAYTETYFDEFQVLVEAGYAVVACNPRGSASYGGDHGKAIKGDMGNLDMTDIISFFDQAVASDKALDGDNAGIMGGSYGGYMTAWIIAHDHRFKGAIVERGFLDGLSFVGSSDIGWFFPGEYQGHEDVAMNRQSPMLLIDRVKTPTLVLHSEQDLRCPLAQGLTYYARLKKAGVDAELLVFPGETHELTRSGTPWHRRQRFDKVLDFWKRKFKD